MYPGIPVVTTSLVQGTTTNDSAADGLIGEYVSSTVAGTTTGLTSPNAANITSISLTAGDWDVRGTYVITGTGTTSFTLANCGISTTSATLPATNLRNTRVSGAFVPTDVYVAAEVPMQRISVATTTTVYLVAAATFSISTAGAGGVLSARRVR
jgi:hypothetical protein